MIPAGNLADFPIRHPRTVLLLTSILTAVLAFGIQRLGIDASIESMIVAGDADHLAFEDRKRIFGSDEVVAVAIPFRDAISGRSLSVQRRVAARIEALPGVVKVDALVTVDDIRGNDDALIVEPLVPDDVDPEHATEETLAHIRQRVSQNRTWIGALVSRDRRTAALQVHLEEAASENDRRTALLRQLQRALGEELDGEPYYLAGHPYMKAEIARTMQRDLSLFLPVTVGIMAVLLVVGVGSLRTAAILLSSILLAVIWMLGAMGWAGDSLTALSNTAPTILLALGTAYFMHLAASYQKELGSGGSHEQVVMRALQRVRRPTVVAGVTTAIGFGSLATSSIPLVRGFGIDLAAGIIAVVIIACTTVPSALVLFSPGPGAGVLAGGRRLGVWLFRITQLDARAPRVIVGASLVLLVGAAVAALRLDVDSSGPNAFPADSPFRISSDFYRDHISGDVIENVYLTVPEEGALKNPEKLKAMLAFQAAAEALPEIDNSVSIANYIALMNRALEGDELSEERIPASREAVAQYLLLYSLSGDLTKFDDLVDESYTNARIILNASVPSSAASARLRKRLTGLAQDHFGADAGRPPVLSTEILLSQAADALATEQVRSFATALLLIIAIVTVAFRSLTAGARLLLPNSLPIALGFGVMSLLGLTLSESTALIAVVALGIAVDGTVHLLSAIRDSERAHGSRPAAVAHGMQTAGRPVIVTGLIVVIGFSVLLLSEFRLVSELGGLTALTIFYCVVADLVVLPAQLLSRWRISGDADTRLSARGRGPGAALIQIDGSTGTARLVSEANGEASFELLEPHCDWHDCGGTKMTVNWLADVPLERGRVIRVDGSAPMMLSVQWAGSERQRHGVEDSVK